MPNEVELKLRILSADVPRLRHHPAILSALTGKPITRKLTSIYYDTPQLALLDAGISLRVRRMSGGWFQAVKAAGHSSAGLHQRMEWEDTIAFGHPDFSKITEPALTKIFDSAALRSALAPIFTTEVARTEWHLAWENGDRIELALDLGDLVIGEQREPIREIELELKGGNIGRLFELALALQHDLPLELENVSKAQRGYAYYRPQPPVVVRAHRTHLQKHLSAQTAFKKIAWECLSQLQGNQDIVLNESDVEGIHQMRVALRRLRSTFSVFRDIVDHESCALIRDEIRWLAEALGKARDLDVFITQTLPPILHQLPEHPGLMQLSKKARTACQIAHEEVRIALTSQRYQRLLLSLGAWLEALPEQADHLQAPQTGAIAQAVLSKRYRQLRKHGKRLDKMLPEERHATRIAAKKLRYATEFFSGLYPETRSHAFFSALTRLQDILGELNDITETENILRSLWGDRPGHLLEESLHIVAGWNACHATHLSQSLELAWRRFVRIKTCWG